MNAAHSKANRNVANLLHTGLNPFTPIGTHKGDGTVSGVTELFPEGNALIDLTDEQRARVNCVLLQTTGQNIRYSVSSNPTASFGFVLTTNQQPLLILLPPGTTLRVIETVATATIQYQYGQVAVR